jgi:hypothetical protein
VLIEHRGEAEYDFRHELHCAFRDVVERDVEEALRLAGQLVRSLGTRLNAAVAGWDVPISPESLLLASLYTAWTKTQHPLMPNLEDRSLSDVETRLADMALENMNRR